MRASVEVGASRKIRSSRRLHRAREVLALLGRIVDHQHSVDTGSGRIGGTNARPVAPWS
jgi:hypothetical protein